MNSEYLAGKTALLHVDPYNDFISDGGKLWNVCKETIETQDLLAHTRQIIAACDVAGILRIIVPHHQWRPGDYAGWEHMSPTQVQATGVKLFEAGSWGGEFRSEFAARDQDVVCSHHWGSSGFANTDLELHLTQRGISHVVLIGMRANTCIDTTARFAQELGYHVTMISDAIVAFSMPEITTTLELNAPTYAHSIRTTAEFTAAVS